jgi:hypothetical protein
MLDKKNSHHINLVKGLFYAWYRPKDAAEYLQSIGINTTSHQLTQMFHALRSANMPQANREKLLMEYLDWIEESNSVFTQENQDTVASKPAEALNV